MQGQPRRRRRQQRRAREAEERKETEGTERKERKRRRKREKKKKETVAGDRVRGEGEQKEADGATQGRAVKTGAHSDDSDDHRKRKIRRHFSLPLPVYPPFAARDTSTGPRHRRLSPYALNTGNALNGAA